MTWRRADEIVERVTTPRFPDHDFSVTTFGAVGDGRADCTTAIRLAIDVCHHAGGGRVVAPSGVYLTGPIHLRNNVNLHVDRNAVIRFSRDPNAYLPPVYTRWQGIECMNYSPLIYAFEQDNIAITGGGTLDGNADEEHWWPWSGAAEYGWHDGQPKQSNDWRALEQMAAKDLPVRQRVFGNGHYLRPNFIQPYRCRNVLIEGVRIIGSPMWEIHPTLCENVVIQDVTVDSHGPNNDGVDPESCRGVVIRRCTIDAGDDSIAIKSGRERDGLRVNTPSEDIVIEDCDLTLKYGAITIGSELTGGVRNVFVRDCRIGGPGLYYGLYIKTNSVRGGFVDGVHLRDIVMTNVDRDVVNCNFYRGEGDVGQLTPQVGNITVDNLRVLHAGRALYMRGYPRTPITGVRISDCEFQRLDDVDRLENVDGLVLDRVTGCL